MQARELVKSQILRRRHHAARYSGANHEEVLFACLSLIPVVLLIDPVELQELLVILREPIRLRTQQRLTNASAKRGII